MKKNINTTFNDIINNVNDIDTLTEIQQMFVESCNRRKEILEVKENAKNLNIPSYLYIKESFENMSETLFKTPKGRKLISKYISEHKSNKDITKLYQIYENISNADKTINIVNMIQDMKNIVGNIKEHNLKKGTERLGNILKEAYVLIGKDAENLLSENKRPNLPDYVNYVFTNELNMNNVVTYNKCINEIKSYVDENTVKGIKLKSNKLNLEECYQKYNELMNSETLSEDSMKIINEIKNSENRSDVFEKYKNECLAIIEEAINTNIEQSVCDKLYEFKDKISNKVYNEKTLGEDVSNFIELKNLVKE